MKQKQISFRIAYIIFVSLTGLAIFLMTAYLESLSTQKQVNRFSNKFEDELKEFRQIVDLNVFWGRKIKTAFSQNASAESLLRELSREFKRFEMNPAYICFGSDGKIFKANYRIENPQLWIRAAEILRDFMEKSVNVSEFEVHRIEELMSDEDYLLLRRLLGNLFFPRKVLINSSAENPRLTANDFSEEARSSWISFDQRKGIFCFFNPEELKYEKHIGPELQELRQKFNNQAQISLRKGLADSSSAYRVRSGKLIFERQLLANQFLQVELDLLQQSPLTRLFQHRGVGLLFYSFLAMMCFTFIKEQKVAPKFRFGILKKFLALYFISNAIILIPIAFLTYDYLKDFRSGLMDEVKNNGLRFMRQLDEKMVYEEARQLGKIREKYKILQEKLKSKQIELDDLREFQESIVPVSPAFYCVASSTAIPIYLNGAMVRNMELVETDAKFKQELEEIVDQRAKDLFLQDRINRAMGMSWQIRALLARLNATKLDRNQQLKIEVFFDTIGFNEPEILLQEFFACRDRIFDLGMGPINFRITFNFLANEHTGKYDYGFLYSFNESASQQEYIEQNYFGFNRNSFALKIGVVHRNGISWPSALMQNPEIKALFSGLSSLSPFTEGLVELENEKNLAMALKGEKCYALNFISFYPVAKIDKKVRNRFINILGLLLAVSLISFGFSLFLARSINEPVKELKKGVRALGARNFSTRLEITNKDEFGDLAQVFNRTLSDLEELQDAGFIQEKLLPQMNSNLVSGEIRIFGKTRSLNDLGGDYFDILQIGEKTGIIVGDVAGHGVAAAMIMAFVKSCVLILSDLYLKPLDFVNRLNLLFRTTRSKKQRKFMSFQYLLFNEDASFSFVNAGHCFPLLYDSGSKEIQQLKMINSPLGTSAKLLKEAHEYQLKKGQSLILYSDGFYEVGDLGFEQFCEVLAQSWSEDPREHYQRIEKRINELLGSYEETDDKTLIIISRSV